MAKKKNSRKALAVALGIMGVAGLSMASASQLNVTPGNEVAMGVSAGTFASCDDAVGIEYGYNATTNVINSVKITGINDVCAGKPMSFSIANGTTAANKITGSTTAIAFDASPATSNNRSMTVTVIAPTTVPLTDDLGAATVIIG